MTNKEILQADMLDILFEHRNKLYGAYALRRTYSHRLGLALGVALSLVLLFVLMSFLKKNNENNGAFNDDSAVILTDVTIPKEETKKPEIPKEQPKPKARSDYQPIVVVPDKEADPQIVENNNLPDTEISNQNAEGEKPDDLAKSVTPSNGTGSAPDKEPEETKPVLPTRNASFPGGTAAWLDFLRKFLQSPENIEPGQRIEVLVRFWIDIDGNISKPEVIKSGGKSFDKEVLRVLKKMPPWEPAIQNGNYVAVPYTQPVIFLGVEE